MRLAGDSSRGHPVRRHIYQELLRIARRHACGDLEAEDLLQEALLEALRHGRPDMSDVANRRWLAGVLKNRSKMARRASQRRRVRERDWQDLKPECETAATVPELGGLSRSARQVAVLALAGCTRAEICWILKISDAALRQRISVLKRDLPRAPGATEKTVLEMLPFGARRRSMITGVRQTGAHLGSHDPDGHIFFLGRSQNVQSRQQVSEHAEEETTAC